MLKTETYLLIFNQNVFCSGGGKGRSSSSGEQNKASSLPKKSCENCSIKTE